MKKKLLIAFIYLSGCVCSYFLLKKHSIYFNTKMGEKIVYSVGDRTRVLSFSIFSWVSAIAGVLLNAEDASKENKNTPAKW